MIVALLSADSEEVFKKHTNEEISKELMKPAQGEVVHYEMHPMEPAADNSLETGTYKIGTKIVHRFWCLVVNRSAWIGVRILADGAFDDAASSALATACGSARLD